MAVAIEFGSQGSAASTSSVATIAGMDFNAEASDRLIAVCIVNETADNTTDIVTAVTIGGVSATKRVESNTTFLARSWIWVASVPTGTSGSVVITLNATDATMSCATFSVTGAEEVPTDSDASTAASSVADLSITALTIPTDGAGITTFCHGTSTSTTTWTGATEQHDTNVASQFNHSSAIVTTAGTNTITADGATSAFQSLVGVAFGPAGGGGGSTPANDNIMLMGVS